MTYLSKDKKLVLKKNNLPFQTRDSLLVIAVRLNAENFEARNLAQNWFDKNYLDGQIWTWELKQKPKDDETKYNEINLHFLLTETDSLYSYGSGVKRSGKELNENSG